MIVASVKKSLPIGKSWMSLLLLYFVVLAPRNSILVLGVDTAAVPASVTTTAGTAGDHYMLIGVSGGLQEGFPAHTKLHYHDKSSNNSDQANASGDNVVVKALFLGRGFVRGYKAFLDVMEEGWREYTADPGQPVINSNVFASGCYEHANEYWLYLVDARHVLSVLNNEPRFLSMTPDTGMIELSANETSPLVRDFFKTHFHQSPTIQNVAIPLVTCVYFHENSHIPSPPIHRHDDGTMVTNFPDSLALWAKVNDSDRTAMLDTTKRCKSSPNGDNDGGDDDNNCPPEVWVEALKADQRYWNGIRKAIRHAEQYRPNAELTRLYAPPFECKKKVRFGVGPDDNGQNIRLNYPLSITKVQQIIDQMGYNIDFQEGEIRVASKEDGASSISNNDDFPDL